MADDGRAGPAAHLLGEPVPRPDGLGLQAAPGQPHQVEGGQEVRVEPVGGVEDAGVRQHAVGCGTARPGGTTCRSWGCPRAAGPACVTPTPCCSDVGVISRVPVRAAPQRQRRTPASDASTPPAPVVGQQRVRIAVHSVASADQPVATSARPGERSHVAVLGRHHEWRPARRRPAAAAACGAAARARWSGATRQAEHGGDPAARSTASAESAAGARGRPADAEQAGQRPPGRARRGPARARPGPTQVRAARSRSTRGATWLRSTRVRSHSSPARAAGVERAGGPRVGEHRRPGRAEHEHARAHDRPAAGHARPGRSRIGSASSGSPTRR